MQSFYFASQGNFYFYNLTEILPLHSKFCANVSLWLLIYLLFLQLQQVLDSFIIFAAQQSESNIHANKKDPPLSYSLDMAMPLNLPWTKFSPSKIRIVPFPTRSYTDEEFQSIIKRVMGVLYVFI